MEVILAALAGLALGALGAFLLLSGRREQLSARVSELETSLTHERRAFAEKLGTLTEAEQRLSAAFSVMSADALRLNNQSFLTLAQATLEKYQEGAKGDLEKRQQAITELLKPVHESLTKFDGNIRELEKSRSGAYESLTQQLRTLSDSTTRLDRALRAPAVRGRWGELQLKRVVELAGMVAHCDFYEQASAMSDEGRLRPDLLVRLPGGKQLVIDAKTPLAAYLDAIDAPDDPSRAAKFRDHARQVRDHMAALSKKSYWDQFQPAPEFVVLFLPGEMFFSAALEHDPSLLEGGVEQRVILATPTTLIALLKAVAYGWRQESVAENARAIGELGREFYKRLSDLGKHLSRVGQSLGSSVEAYNKAVGSLESRVVVTARRLEELDAKPAGMEIEPLATIETTPRLLQVGELIEGDGARDSGTQSDQPPLLGDPKSA